MPEDEFRFNRPCPVKVLRMPDIGNRGLLFDQGLKNKSDVQVHSVLPNRSSGQYVAYYAGIQPYYW